MQMRNPRHQKPRAVLPLPQHQDPEELQDQVEQQLAVDPQAVDCQEVSSALATRMHQLHHHQHHKQMAKETPQMNDLLDLDTQTLMQANTYQTGHALMLLNLCAYFVHSILQSNYEKFASYIYVGGTQPRTVYHQHWNKWWIW